MMEISWTRRNVLSGLLGASAAAMTFGAWANGDDVTAEAALAARMGLDISADRLRQVKNLLAAHPAVDVHSHPGRFFMRGADLWDQSARIFLAEADGPERSVGDMAAGGLAAACFSVVADMRSLVLTPEGGLRALRPLAEGEIWADYKRQIGEFRRLLQDGSVSLVSSASDIVRNHAKGQLSAILTAEGGDFLEGDLGRLAEAWNDGMRSITIVHYRVNEVGDIQTEAATHGGLTPFGADLVRAMNAQGMLIDLAHASFETTRQVVAITQKPVMLSHSHLGDGPGANPRLISVDHARLVAGTGGVIGSWPAGITQRSFGDFITETLRLIDAVGVDHVAIGTDMDANYRPVFDSYRQWPLAVALLLERKMSEADVAKIIGGNFLRVFAAAAA